MGLGSCLLCTSSIIFYCQTHFGDKRKSTASVDSDHILSISSQKDSSTTLSSSSSSQWSSSLAVSLVRPQSREVSQGSSKTAEGEAGSNILAAPTRPGSSSPSLSRLNGGLPLQAQVARSELNVRLPRGTWVKSVESCTLLPFQVHITECIPVPGYFFSC